MERDGDDGAGRSHHDEPVTSFTTADGFHHSVWPGENGLAFVTGLTETVYWGVDAPPSAVVAGGGFGAGVPRFDRDLRLA